MRTRREVLAATAAALVVPKASFAQAEPPKPKQLIFNASGGSQIASLRENYLNDFEKETGIKIVDTSPVDFGKLRAMVESGNVVWNITEIGGQDGYRVTQMGLAEPIDAKIIDRSKFQPQAQMSHVFSPSCYSTVICYRQDAFPNGAPKSWADFWDVKAFPGPRSLRNHPVDNLEAVLRDADSILAGLTEKDLSRSVVIQERDTTVLAAVYHVVEHFSMHTGQIVFLTKIYAPDKIHFYDDAGGAARPIWHQGTALDEAAH